MGSEEVAATAEQSTPSDTRVLILTATAKDAALTLDVFSSANLSAATCATVEALIAEVSVGAAAVLLAEEALSSAHTAALRRTLAAQPPWSDLPLLILTRPGADSAELDDAVRALGNVTLLERPLRVSTLLSSVRTAMRARQRQYEIRRHLAERTRTETLLRQADQRKDEFIATLGHELRNPLAPLLTGLQLLKTTPQPKDTLIPIMERQLGHLTRLVDDLLEVSRIERGLIEVRHEPTDLESVVQSAIETSRPAIAAAEHELTVEMPAEAITVDGDAVRLTQVFANLLGNATKYTNSGGHITISVRREGNRAIVSVRDTGIGIPPEQIGSVFEMFTQVDRSSRRSQGGLGIGLTLVRSLVTMHGGRVEARSEGINAGSEFIVELPIARAPRQDVSVPDTVERLPPRRILVVDDNADAAHTLSSLLDTLGATVRVSHNGPEALAAFDAFHPDAVLLDIGMPGMDGYEVARRLRAGNHNGLLLVALTGWGQEHDQDRARAAGFDHHMIKPPDLEMLRTVLCRGWNGDRDSNQ